MRATVDTDPGISTIFGRNGEYAIGQIEIMNVDNKRVYIGGISAVKKVVVRGGLLLTPEAMDELCLAWLKTRKEVEPWKLLAVAREVHGAEGTMFVREDIEQEMGRRLTDDEWKSVQDSHEWRHLNEPMCDAAWSVIHDIIYYLEVDADKNGRRMYSLINDQGAAIAECTLCSECWTKETRREYEANAPADAVTDLWHDTTDNEALECVKCGYKVHKEAA